MRAKQPLPCDADQALAPGQPAFQAESQAEAQAEMQAKDWANSADGADAAATTGQAAASAHRHAVRQGAGAWLAARLPSLVKLYQRNTRHYIVPKNLNIW